MEHVLYADILFFINFSMDLITLYLTSRLTSGPPMGLRTVAAAAIGGIWGTLSVALLIDGIAGVIAAGAVSLIMVIAAFGRDAFPAVLRRAAVFWGFAALLGGVMTAICSFGEFGAPGSPAGGTAILFAGSALSLIIMKAFARYRRRRAVRVRIALDGRTAEFEALVDSGNLVTDPLSSKPVILADASALRPVLPEIPPDGGEIPECLRHRIRMIPARGIGGGELLTGFVPDSVTVTVDGRERRSDAVIAVTRAGAEFFGGYPSNVPAAIL